MCQQAVWGLSFYWSIRYFGPTSMGWMVAPERSYWLRAFIIGRHRAIPAPSLVKTRVNSQGNPIWAWPPSSGKSLEMPRFTKSKTVGLFFLVSGVDQRSTNYWLCQIQLAACFCTAWKLRIQVLNGWKKIKDGIFQDMWKSYEIQVSVHK